MVRKNRQRTNYQGKRKDVLLSTRIPETMKDKLTAISKREEISVSYLIREAIYKLIKNDRK